MAQVFLPCESQQWVEDKKYFRRLSMIRTAEQFESHIYENSESADEKVVNTAQRLYFIQGLSVFISQIATFEERQVFFKRTLPFICRSASCLDVLVPDQGVPFLRQQEGASVILGRKLVLSLIANAFLCTFPHEHPLGKKAKPFSFHKFFKLFKSGDKSRITPQVAKMRCFLNYFNRMSYREEDGVPGIITCSRQAIAKDELPTLLDWIACDYPLCNVSIDNEKKIEDAGSRTLQVDFAAAHLGGGVLRGGAVQEEIRFCICPELLVSILITDTMEDNEAILITGYERFSYYNGYSSTFKFAGDYEDPSEKDVYGNLHTALSAIDALRYGTEDIDQQYNKDNFLRDLNKAFVGFMCREDRGDISLHNIPMRQGEYDEEVDDDNDTSSLITDDDNELDDLSVSLSNDIIGNALRGISNAVDDEDDDNIRVMANSLVGSVIQEVLDNEQQPVDQEQCSTVDMVAASTVNSIMAGVKGLFVSKPSVLPKQDNSSSTDQDVPLSSGSSGLPVLAIDFIDSIVDEAINNGINDAIDPPIVHVNIEDTEKDQTHIPSPSDDDSKEKYAETLASNILGSVIPTTAVLKSVVGLSSAGGGNVSKTSPAHRGKVKKSKHQQNGGSRRSFPRSSLNMTDGAEIMDPRSLNPPSSRMSVAWSTTSTRGEDSLPTSPTELDNLAINMVSNIGDLSTVMADLIIRDAIQACTLPRDISDHLTQYEQASSNTTSKGMSKIDTFLQSLHEADSRSSLDISIRGDGLVPFSPPLHNIRKEILRPVATGNWGCGAFKGDPQLKSMLQWMAVSANGRPEMKYYPFNDKRVEQLSKIVDKFRSSNTTVGQLGQLISQYCTKRTDRRCHDNKGEDLFTYLLNNN